MDDERDARPGKLRRHVAPALKADPADRGRSGEGGLRTASPRRRRRLLSPLTRRILFLNLVGPALLAFGLLYLDDYRRGLIDSQLGSLLTQARIIATALSESARSDEDGEAGLDYRLTPDVVRPVLFRLIEPTRSQARVFGLDGRSLADTRVLSPFGGEVIVEPLPPPVSTSPGLVESVANAVYDALVVWLPERRPLPIWPDAPEPRAEDFDEAQAALLGDPATRVRAFASGPGIILSVAVPVQRFKQVLGATMLTMTGDDIERRVRDTRFDILKLCLGTLLVTALASIYLASTIARPIRRLAAAAERVRRGHGIGATRVDPAAKPAIPDMRARGDEIGDLSGTLADMTTALWQRLDAIERFAADVSHEIKNPLTSLKSAVETAARVKDPAQREKMMQIILDDVQRIDRLIADISGASRLDAELSRSRTETVDVSQLLQTLVDVYAATSEAGAPRVVLEVPPDARLAVSGIEDRLGQVLRNLIANAASFSPPDGTIRLAARATADAVEIVVDDDGPGIPEDKFEKIFDRFYSERPEGEKFGTHSGLGLSISRQIVNAHGGTIWAENRLRGDGTTAGARFVIRLPRE
ncbi:MAG: sensor N-terminal transmembrane domain-containing protein [Alphaproteobacteria bacterium]|nr:sensor N-terminal transmembrane domain-containing protein [Alphaproteobacteria bacterium]